jgi:hypothetical protein
MRVLVKEAIAESKWAQRDLVNGNVFGYDFNDQMTAVKLNVPNPDTVDDHL